MHSSANFQRDGRAVHDDNQGNRPNYPSTREKLNLPKRPYNDANHTIWVNTLDSPAVSMRLSYIWLIRLAEQLDISPLSLTSILTGQKSL
jgi:hypothetical protein